MGYCSFMIKRLYRFQLYYPTFSIKNGLFIELDTCFRIEITHKYKTVAFCILGFGVGFDYCKDFYQNQEKKQWKSW